MNFNFSEEQLNIKKQIESLGQRELAAEALQLDKSDSAVAGKIIKARLKKLGTEGLLAVGFPAEFGGKGDQLAKALLIEELARFSCSLALSVIYSSEVVARALLLHGSKEQQDKYLPKLLSGEMVGAFAGAEAGMGFSLGEFKGEAVTSGSGYKLSGKKVMVVNGADADVILDPMYSEPGADPEQGISLFLVDGKASGLKIADANGKLGFNGASIADIDFVDCEVPREGLLGKPQGGLPLLKDIKAYEALGLACLGVGMTNACLLHTAGFAKEAKIGDKPIMRNQEISFKFSDMFLFLDTARLLIQRTIWLLEKGDPAAAELAFSAKVHATESAAKAAAWLVQIMGVSGAAREISRDSVVDRLFRDAKMSEIIGGSTESHRINIAKQVISQVKV